MTAARELAQRVMRRQDTTFRRLAAEAGTLPLGVGDSLSNPFSERSGRTALRPLVTLCPDTAGALRDLIASDPQNVGESGRSGHENPATLVSSNPERSDHTGDVIQSSIASERSGLFSDPLIAQIRHWHRINEDFVRADGDLLRRIRAICRRETGDWKGGPNDQGGKETKALEKRLLKGKTEITPDLFSVLHLILVRGPIKEQRKECEKRLQALVEQLPVWPWVEAQRGVSHATLARLVGEIGDLACYPNPAKVWSRMGVGIRTIDGQRVRQKADAKDWAIHRYSPRRRAVLWAGMEPLMKMRNPTYRPIYDARRAHTAMTHPEWKKQQSHFDALRIMSKAFLKDFWVAWNAHPQALAQQHGLLPGDPE